MKQNSQIRHIGIIMDGNRRWAKNQGLPALIGHKKGYEKMKAAGKWCADRGIGILTVYAFSSENWNRSKEEVNYLMNLFRRALKNEIAEIHKNGIKMKVIGQKEKLPEDIQDLIKRAEEKTKANKKLLFNIAISYGGRPEIVSAIKKMIAEKIPASKITEDLVAKYLWTKGQPDPDIIIRTSGEQRLSNFLTWQSAYTELFFIKKHWPDFEEKDLDEIIKEYSERQRRFGK
ncbi:MAG: di-trans,poly-cis-decaprenylcistransferase [Candidatus Buchananbacteria bacterium RIFCSPHIGHO2_02_FULL_45_11b]|uniref:Isoprenyl transferase n=3 Tax=Candidatus Buchananiibacteriota TaxID=1817903 RepID=A0A1G1YML3_9BACT|nr:MAG: di-trans,poly-cis-decaprenylcistransferase [Candidatus Buchananbacteria bacterium RIFCSPHIGHO2_01_FULL_46_12]OGY50681.1 MAG: di-trans,poly-cis-decaprenylcistransferase [Candidatus Buchananbacteria bacterium RIFCSPHIGHO2_02_FULL_45_11b]OGY53539.1 MAG: di-trans,poly-cis-decaprenylcistransferase [Candidatus Buchananbacteria bacterium RIFCSPLOWO2_01_FULL_45_31]